MLLSIRETLLDATSRPDSKKKGQSYYHYQEQTSTSSRTTSTTGSYSVASSLFIRYSSFLLTRPVFYSRVDQYQQQSQSSTLLVVVVVYSLQLVPGTSYLPGTNTVATSQTLVEQRLVDYSTTQYSSLLLVPQQQFKQFSNSHHVTEPSLGENSREWAFFRLRSLPSRRCSVEPVCLRKTLMVTLATTTPSSSLVQAELQQYYYQLGLASS